MDKPVKQRDYALDAARVIAILAVVLIHVSTRVLEATHYGLNSYGYDLLLNQLARFAVPFFFAISGFSLEISFNNNTNYLSFFKKRTTKILIPYVFWSAIFFAFVYTNHNFSFLKSLTDGSASYQLYFIPALLIFYILFPFIHKFYKQISNIWVFISLAILELFLLRQDYFIKPLAINYSLRIVMLNYFVFVAGVVAAKNKEIILKMCQRYWPVLSGISIYMICFINREAKNMYFKIWNIDAIYSQWRPSIFIYTIVFGLLLYFIFTKLNYKFWEKLSNLSFFVFFIHTAILEIVWNIVKNFSYKNYIFEPVLFAAVALISFAIAYIAHKIPYLAKLTG